MGSVGPRSIIAVYLQDTAHVQYILDCLPTLSDERCPHELLYGSAGYIYALLFILKYWPTCPLRQEVIDVLE
jgi:hypothetical protein